MLSTTNELQVGFGLLCRVFYYIGRNTGAHMALHYPNRLNQLEKRFGRAMGRIYWLQVQLLI